MPWPSREKPCAGEVRQAITRDVLALAADGKAETYEKYDYYPQKWTDLHRDRRRTIGWALYGLLGIQKGDREASAIVSHTLHSGVSFGSTRCWPSFTLAPPPVRTVGQLVR